MIIHIPEVFPIEGCVVVNEKGANVSRCNFIECYTCSIVDLLISANVKGLKFYGLVEDLRTSLRKKVDVLDLNQLKDNLELTEEILKDGVKIYG